MKIIDCFTFYNEIELLNYRLNILNDVVDYFILVEATHTHTGKPKNLIYLSNKHLFSQFEHKIIHIVDDAFKYIYPKIDFSKDEQWENEKHQRQSIELGIKKLNLDDKDLVIVSDLDEIPDPCTLQIIRQSNMDMQIYSLEMDFYYYNLNSKFVNNWYHPKIFSYKFYKQNTSINDMRKCNCYAIRPGGWHLSYFSDAEGIKNKIQNFAHQEFNNTEYTDLNKIKERMENNKDLYDRPGEELKYVKLEDNNYLPFEYSRYLRRFFQ